ncbi:hypothetical protein BDV3_004629 [Batrachochytrium dendrobatidis]
MLPRIDGTTEKDHGRILKPILDVATKWNSTFDMLVTALKMREPLVQILDQLYMEKKIPDVPSARDWDDLTELVYFFQPFKQATMECSSNKYQTLSYVIPCNHCVIAVVLDPRHKLEFYDDENQNVQENAFQKEKIKKANPKRLCRVPQSKWLDAIRGIQNGIGLVR